METTENLTDSESVDLLPVLREPRVEILERPRAVQLVTARHPFSLETATQELAHGLTIADLLRHAGIPAWASVVVYVNGDLVYPEYYRVVRPKPDSHVLVKVVPRSSGGGSSRGKNIGYIVGGILLIVAGIIALNVPYLESAGVPLITAGAGLLLSGEIGLLIPPRPAPASA